MATVVREAIDLALPADPSARAAAAADILAAPRTQVPRPDGLREELDELRARRS